MELDDEPQSDDKVKDLTNDSLDFVEVCMAVEEEFSIEVPDEHFEAVVTYADLQKCVSHYLSRTTARR